MGTGTEKGRRRKTVDGREEDCFRYHSLVDSRRRGDADTRLRVLDGQDSCGRGLAGIGLRLRCCVCSAAGVLRLLRGCVEIYQRTMFLRQERSSLYNRLALSVPRLFYVLTRSRNEHGLEVSSLIILCQGIGCVATYDKSKS